jgi:hypothetical protein
MVACYLAYPDLEAPHDIYVLRQDELRSGVPSFLHVSDLTLEESLRQALSGASPT